MILRKPYAFLIKNFKIIHFILSVLMSIIIYKFTNILSFFNEYLASKPNIINKNVASSLYPKSIVIYMVIVLVFAIIIMSLMQWKKKPITFYSYLIFTIIGSGAILFYSYNIVLTLEEGLVAVKTLRTVRDLSIVSIIAESLSLIILIVRAMGFDVKKFDFGKEMLKVNDSDREEFEFDVSFDSDKFKRNFRRNMRNIKYTYKENKLLINLVLGVIFAVICAIIYININIYNKKYDENTTVSVDGFTFGITSSSYTKFDNRGNIMSDDSSYIITNLKIKSNLDDSKSIDINNFKLYIDKKEYDISNNKNLFDLGKIYTNQNISKNFESYILIFEIPNEELDKKITLLYKANSGKNIKFKISAENIDKKDEINEYKLNDTVDFKDSLIDGTKLIFNGYDVQDKFKVEYNFCINNNCNDSYEYIYRTLTGNYDKTILKLNYVYETGSRKIDGVDNIYSLINKMAIINYSIGNNTYTNAIGLKEIKPNNVLLSKTLFLEVDENIKNADSITISFRLRNKVYNYKLK